MMKWCLQENVCVCDWDFVSLKGLSALKWLMKIKQTNHDYHDASVRASRERARQQIGKI